MGVLFLGGACLMVAQPALEGASAYVAKLRGIDYEGAYAAPGARRLLSHDDPFVERYGADGRLLSEAAPSMPPPAAPPSCIDQALGVGNETGFPDTNIDDPGSRVVLQVFVIFYTFMGLAIICDVYFESALEAISEGLKLKDDVAGATFMAAGGSAPELSTSVLGVFVAQNDVGIGTIIGSAVFNVLFVIACCAFVAPNLRLSWWPLARDSIYYCISICFLVAFIVDSKVHIWEAIVLLLMYAGYVTIMYYNEALEQWVNKRVELTKKERAPWQKQILWVFEQHWFNLALYFIIVANTVVVIFDMGIGEDADEKRIFDILNFIFSACFVLEMLVKWAALGFFGYWRGPLNCFDGVLVMLIIVEISLGHAMAVVEDDEGDDSNLGFTGAGRSLRMFRFFRVVRTLRVFRLYRAFHKHYADATTQVLPGDWHTTSNGMLAPDKNSSRQSQADMNKVEAPPRVSTAGESTDDDDDEDDDDGPANPFEVPESWGGKVFWILGMPLAIAMWITIPDCRRPAFERLFGITFLCSIMWIALLAYFMVWMVTDFGQDNRIPDSIMGLTLLASGTSIPDALSSIAVAKRGHGDMAVSSSIGSNIFDILIGLPVPWLLYTLIAGINHGSFTGPDSYVEIKSDSLIFMILLLFLMVALVITTVHLCGWRLLIKLGYMMMLFYFAFLTVSLLLELVLC